MNRFDHIRIAAGISLTILGMACAYGGSFLSGPYRQESAETSDTENAIPEAVTVPAAKAEMTRAAETLREAESTEAATAANAEAAVFTPAAGTFNLAHVYPEGADPTDPLKSYGGEGFRSIYEKDTDWYAEIFNATDAKPADLAARLGRDRSSVMGKYNIQDATQDVNNPDTWTINKWGKININITDANGKAVDASSNAKEILAMASVYGYYHDWTNYQDFLNYAQNLWAGTHSYRISMGNVYYDAGCITEEKKEAAILKGNGKGSTAASNLSSVIGTGGADAADTAPASEEEIPLDASGSDASEASSAKKSNRMHSAASTISDEKSGPGSGKAAAGNNGELKVEESAAETPAAESELKVESSAPNGSSGASGENGSLSSMDASLAAGVYPSCPGHIDLTVSATVYGFDGARNLFQSDRIGNAKQNMNDRWQGWTAETMQQAIDLANSDWYRDYGLSVSAFSKRTPLTNDEIYQRLTQLPANLSAERRRLIICALRSIGNIPYFFGGKPAAAGYDGNHFFSVISPDYKGRVFRGLDCSGWISWVYWTALGQKLSEQSTSGQVGLGRSVRRDELKPGDIIVRPGSEETIGHVIMFLGWTADGSIECIHETGGHINNVTIGQQTAEWNYRSLLD